jgi:hypothetical protein
LGRKSEIIYILGAELCGLGLWLLKAENVWRSANLAPRNEGRATLDDLIFFSFSANLAPRNEGRATLDDLIFFSFSPVRWDPNRRDNAFFDQSVILHCSYH